MLVTLATWVALFALYLLFAEQASRAELCAGASAAGVGAGLQIYVRARNNRPIALDAPWAKLAGRVVASLARDTAVVATALARASLGVAVRGGIQSQDFSLGSGSPVAAGRQAVVILAASIAPNGFVEEAAKDDALLIHRLVSAPPKENCQWPV